MQISEAAAASGVSAKRIRHYEDIGLIPRPARLKANYRLYSADDVRRLSFIRRARVLGFGISQIGDLLALRDGRSRTCAEVKSLAGTHVADLQAKIGQMQMMVDELKMMLADCHGEDRPECAILDGLEGQRPNARNDQTDCCVQKA